MEWNGMGWLQHSLPKAFLMRTRRLLLAVYTYLIITRHLYLSGSGPDLNSIWWSHYGENNIYEDED